MASPLPQEWRSQQAIVMQRADHYVLQQLKRTQAFLNSQLRAFAGRKSFSAQLREAQIQLAKREIQAEMGRLFRKVGDITSAMRIEAAARVLDVNKLQDRFLFAGAGLADGAELAQAIADAELDAAKSGLDRMMARVQGSSYTPLSQRVYISANGLNGPISTLVNNALAAGLSAREFATLAKDFINPLTPGGVRYASYRLARTEINNAAHALAVDSVQEKPWVGSMKWHLSGSHPRVDICNSLASGGAKGDGVYPKTSVPGKPHPQCFCFVTPETVSEEEFLDSLTSGDYDGYLERYRNIQPGQTVSTRFGGGRPTAPAAARELPGTKAAQGAEKVRATPPSQAPAPPPPAKAVPTVRTTTPVAKAAPPVRPQTPARVSTSPVARINKITGANGQAVDRALEFQNGIAPKSMNRLGEVRLMSSAEQAELGRSTIGGYQHGQNRIVVSKKLFTDSYERAFAREIQTGYSSRCGAAHDHVDGLIGHEFGHHMGAALDFVPVQEKKIFWQGLADDLGLPRPLFMDRASLDKWVEKNKGQLSSAVSKYGATESDELLAEIWLEYSTNPDARPGIKAIGARLKEIAENRR